MSFSLILLKLRSANVSEESKTMKKKSLRTNLTFFLRIFFYLESSKTYATFLKSKSEQKNCFGSNFDDFFSYVSDNSKKLIRKKNWEKKFKNILF